MKQCNIYKRDRMIYENMYVDVVLNGFGLIRRNDEIQ